MWFQGVLSLLVALLSVHGSKQLKENVQLHCKAESLTNTRFTLTGNGSDIGNVILCDHCGGSSDCLHRNETRMNKPDYKCDMHGAQRSCYINHETIEFSSCYTFKISLNDSKIANLTLIFYYVMTRTSYLQDCFDNFRADMNFRHEKSSSLVEINVTLKRFYKEYTTGNGLEMTAFNSISGEKEIPCERDLRKQDLEKNCKIDYFVPCQQYNVCVKTLLYSAPFIDKKKLVNCQNYTMRAEIKSVTDLEKKPNPSLGLTRFSWQESKLPNEAHGFFNTTVEFYGEQNTTVFYVTNQTELELVPPAGTEACSLSVAKCLPCFCSKPIKRHFTPCGVVLPERRKQNQTNSNNPYKTYILLSCIIILLVTGLVVLAVYGFRNSIFRKENTVPDVNLPTIEALSLRSESLSSSDGYETIPLSNERENAYNNLNLQVCS